MAFIPVLPARSLTPAVSPALASRPARPARTAAIRMASDAASRVPQSMTPTTVEGPEDDVCTFGAECELSSDCVTNSPALEKLVGKYLFPMREENTEVFFDNSVSSDHTLMIVFARDRHGLVLDIVSVLKALSIRVHRTASSESDALQLILNRIEGELVSVNELSMSLNNCVAFWLTDEESGVKIYDDFNRLDQLRACIRLELRSPYPRPRPMNDETWHRVAVQKNRADRFTAFSVQTTDRPRLLNALTLAFDNLQIDVASASIQTFADRVENTFLVTKAGFKQPLEEADIEHALDAVMQALLSVGQPGPNETCWYQTRDGTAMLIAEAIFIDEVNNEELACYKFTQHETPNFRGRLPEAPYRPVSHS